MNRDEYYAALQTNTRELKHYGILGMKWGMRKAKKYEPESAERSEALRTEYSKARNKYTNLAYKTAKNNRKLAEIEKKIYDDQHTVWMPHNAYRKAKEVQRLITKRDKLTAKVARQNKKTEKWMSTMKNEFGSVTIQSLSKKDIDSGEEWVKFIMKQNLK